MSERIQDAAKFLLDTGLLAEINRLVLHPRGLALPVKVRIEDGKVSFADYLFSTDDREGMDMGSDLLAEIREKLKSAPPIAPDRTKLFPPDGIEPLYPQENHP